MERTLYLFVCLLVLHSGLVYSSVIEANYLQQTERDALLKFWKRDMDYIIGFLKNSELPSYSCYLSYFVKSQLHRFKFTNLVLHTDNVKYVIEPKTSHINFTQPIGLDYTVDFFWEVSLFLIPFSGRAIIQGQVIDFIYSLNMTQPYEGDMLIPYLDGKWNISSMTIKSSVGDVFGLYGIIKKLFLEQILGPVMDDLVGDILDEVPLLYKEYYKPHSDPITFTGFKNKTIDVMRRYKRFYLDPHQFTVVYQETAGNTFPEPEPEIIKANAEQAGTPTSNTGILRRYMRDVAVLEQIAGKIVNFFNNFTLYPKDLPDNQSMKLDSKSMKIMIPEFEAKYGADANISLVINGENRIEHPIFSPVDTQQIQVSDVLLKFEFFIKQAQDNILFLNSTLNFNLKFRPFCEWKAGNIYHNLEILDVGCNILTAQSTIFGNSISLPGIKNYTSLGLKEFLFGKCKNQILGSGIKMRDELGDVKNVKCLVDAAGKTLNTWIFKID